ncbi:glycosyltransferase family 2 protein [Aquincola sp. J276]|uniref:glycosyltransferase n=1 Tax=Aquincola sp. J276 TaxID=2898432 RepID=UPI0021512F03|nr:glycosyltransferase [Aquincola sp. J276]MCR5868623.1 glycosyltransferase [Aquincola sp. J276]
MIDFTPPREKLRACVIVPVRNEAQRLPATLQALAGQTDAPPYEVLVLANNCSDDSASIVRAFARLHPHVNLQVCEVTLPPPQANVGHARRLLMEEACRRLTWSGQRGAFIASTDGDTRAAPDWLRHTAREIDAGADAVGGRLLAEGDAEADADEPSEVARLRKRWQRWDTAYRLACQKLDSLLDPDDADPWPRHHQHFGASLAVRADAYRAVGGMPDGVPWLEDEALVTALRRADRRIRHSCAVRVITSSRREGRVDVGLSWQLREWDRQSREQGELQVDDPADLHCLILARHQLRGLWRRGFVAPRGDAQWEPLARVLRLPADGLWRDALEATTFGALWHAVAEQRRARGVQACRQVPVQQALAELRRLIDAATPAAGQAGLPRRPPRGQRAGAASWCAPAGSSIW